MSKVLSQRVGDPQAGLDHARDVGRRVTDLLDGARDPQHVAHLLGVLR
jgi:hypothetical protein